MGRDWVGMGIGVLDIFETIKKTERIMRKEQDLKKKSAKI